MRVAVFCQQIKVCGNRIKVGNLAANFVVKVLFDGGNTVPDSVCAFQCSIDNPALITLVSVQFPAECHMNAEIKHKERLARIAVAIQHRHLTRS